MADLNKVLSIEDVSDEQVIVKINVNDPLTVAKYPFLSADMAYITITRGDNHIFTVVKNDGTHWSFSFGSNGYTLIADSVKLLKNKVLEFIEEKRIPLGYDGGTPNKAKIYYNSNFKKWQLTIETSKGSFIVMSNIANDLQSAIKDFEGYVISPKWDETTAVTGIKVWTATEPNYLFK